MAKPAVTPSRRVQLQEGQSNLRFEEPVLSRDTACMPSRAVCIERRHTKSRRAVSQTSERQMVFSFLSHSSDAADAGMATENLLRAFGSFAEIVAAPRCALAKIEGVTDANIELIKAIEQAARQLAQVSLKALPILNNWSKLTEYLTLTMARERNEMAKALFLDTKNQLISDETLNEGDAKFVHISSRKILARALELNSTAVILAHNHPSGDPHPSQQDIDFTSDFRIAASYMDIVLHDHIVVGTRGCFSFRREGLLA